MVFPKQEMPGSERPPAPETPEAAVEGKEVPERSVEEVAAEREAHIAALGMTIEKGEAGVEERLKEFGDVRKSLDLPVAEKDPPAISEDKEALRGFREEQAELRQTSTEALTAEQDAQAEYWLKIMEQEEAEKLKNKPEQTENEKTAAELEAIFREWLAPEKLAALNGLTEMVEAKESPEWWRARDALAEIRTRIKALEGSLSKEEEQGLKDKYRTLSKAVGVVNGGKVDHTR